MDATIQINWFYKIQIISGLTKNNTTCTQIKTPKSAKIWALFLFHVFCIYIYKFKNMYFLVNVYFKIYMLDTFIDSVDKIHLVY